MKQKLGKLEVQFFAYVQMRQWRTVRTGALTGPLRLTERQELKLFSRLARAGMIARVRRGLYLVPPRLPLGGKWSPGEILALTTLIEDRGGRYQICGPNAFNRYGFDEQVPNRAYAYNNRVSGERTVGPIKLTLIKVADERLGSTEEIETAEGIKAVYSSRVRTLMDAVYDWSRFNSLPRGYEWIRKELAAKQVRAAELVSVTLQYGDTGTIRRMGVLLEREGVEGALLRKLERALKPSTSLIPWIPGYPKRGTVNRRWGVVVNDKS
ncbi:MAG: type IV toxin-antitoxin system AbiEi family antitoxin domain-containing protein [Candidatus Methylomirabilaceae bacterium]